MTPRVLLVLLIDNIIKSADEVIGSEHRYSKGLKILIRLLTIILIVITI